MTHSKSVTRFFQTIKIHLPLCNASDFVLQLTFTIAHLSGTMNTAADSSPRLEADLIDKIVVNIRKIIPTKPIDVNIKATSISPEETLFITDDYLFVVPEKDIWQRKAQLLKVTPCQPLVITFASYYYIDLANGSLIIDLAHFKEQSRILIEQDSDPTVLNSRRETFGLPNAIKRCKVYALFPR